jgi:RNA polymerase sigma-70 factor (ECF subfamily)
MGEFDMSDNSGSVEGQLVTTLSDSLLLERIGRGDAESFAVLFHRHYDRVYGLLFRLLGTRAEAEDVAQEVFLKLYRRPLRAGGEHNVSAWLYRTATNMGYNAVRSRRRWWQRNSVLLPEETAGHDPGEQAAERETRARVRAALARLPERQAGLLLLRQMGFSYAELAEVFEVTPGSVGTLLARAADAFRKVYQEERP